jgi:hypothetical protein
MWLIRPKAIVDAAALNRMLYSESRWVSIACSNGSNPIRTRPRGLPTKTSRYSSSTYTALAIAVLGERRMGTW